MIVPANKPNFCFVAQLTKKSDVNVSRREDDESDDEEDDEEDDENDGGGENEDKLRAVS
jgi:hypothetical protein